MAEDHVPVELLRRFLCAEVSPEEARRVVRHLVAGCPDCAELSHHFCQELGLWPRAGLSSALWEKPYEEVFERALAFATQEERQIALEKLRGWGQWAFLEPMNPQERLALVESDSGYHTVGLYDRLLEASRRATRAEPAEAVDIVSLALAVVDRMSPGRIGLQRIADLRAIAWAEFGNAKRLASDFTGARQAINQAWQILEEEGSNDRTIPLIEHGSSAWKPPISTRNPASPALS